MNATLDRPTTAHVTRTPQRTTPATVDRFKGKPFARALHINGIPILDTAQVKRDQNAYKQCYCAQEAEEIRELRRRHPANVPDPLRTTHFNHLAATTWWATVDITLYRMATSGAGGVCLPTSFEMPAIPAEIDEPVKELEAQVPEAKVEVETFDRDPYIRVTLGPEQYYIYHWE